MSGEWRDLGQSSDDCTEAECQQQEGRGQQPPQGPPLTGDKVSLNVKKAVRDAEAHVEAVGQYEADTSGPPRQHVGQEQERHRQAQHHQVIPEDTAHTPR